MEKSIIAIQMDPLNSINIESDSSLLIAQELFTRGHKIFIYEPKDLSLIENKVAATGFFASFDKNHKSHYQQLNEESLFLNEMDIILIRQDPPFDMNYISATYLLDLIKDEVLILNDPTQIRSNPEKLAVYNFPEFVPPAIISYDHGLLRDFWHEHKDVVIKPLYGHGGNDIRKITINDDCETILSDYLKQHGQIMLQKFFPSIGQDGDKRVIMINGKVAGAIGRIPPKNDIRANLAVGGTATKTTLSARENEICVVVGEFLKQRNLFLAGLDFINEQLIEINLTSPTGLKNINDIYNTHIEKVFVDELEALTNNC